jgi:3-oxoacyl-[acyl-carrier protein] reductase
MDLGLDGKRAAVAASSAGLGLATARALVAEGVAVAICGRDPERLAAAAASLGAGVVALEADVGDVDGATGFVVEARERLGGLDILVANAGGPPPGTAMATTIDAYRDAIDLNLLSTVAMCLAAVPGMRAQGWGRVLAITSIGVRQPIPFLAASVTARAGATGFLKTLATEVAGDGVTVNSIQPGSHLTDRLRQMGGTQFDELRAEIPAGAPGDPDDFGSVAAFLCSRQAAFVTGATLVVDGGASRGLL